MELSAEGILFIQHWEGFVAKVYDDVAGHPTIGYGHFISKRDIGKWMGRTLTLEEGQKLLMSDLKSVEIVVNRFCIVPITQGQYDALVSFCFNIGSSALAKSTLLRKLNSGDYEGAADEFHRWDHAGGKVIPGLTARRVAEKKLFEQPDKFDKPVPLTLV